MDQSTVEVVSKGQKIEIYFFKKDPADSKPQDVSGFKVTAKAEMPRTKKIEEIALTSKGTFLEATFDAKGSHRYTLWLTVTDLQVGHADKVKFTIEPRK